MFTAFSPAQNGFHAGTYSGIRCTYTGRFSHYSMTREGFVSAAKKFDSYPRDQLPYSRLLAMVTPCAGAARAKFISASEWYNASSGGNPTDGAIARGRRLGEDECLAYTPYAITTLRRQNTTCAQKCLCGMEAAVRSQSTAARSSADVEVALLRDQLTESKGREEALQEVLAQLMNTTTL